MAFFRFSRDKRGYEHFYLVEPLTNRKGKSRPRVLYWYRTPPNVKVGREPFDDEMRRAIEAKYPDVTFDWAKIIEAPIPSAEGEKWRERRRSERAERTARRSAAVVESTEEDVAVTDEPETDAEPADDAADTTADAADAAADAVPIAPARNVPRENGSGRKRRRRRRGRGHAPSGEMPNQVSAETPDAAQPAAEPASDVPPHDPIDGPSGE